MLGESINTISYSNSKCRGNLRVSIEAIYQRRRSKITLRFKIRVFDLYGNVSFPQSAIEGHNLLALLQGPLETLFSQNMKKEICMHKD